MKADFTSANEILDINECQQQNGGCSHGCINTPGDFYCACPPGMMRDPVNPKACINIAGSFDRIAELLGRYLNANREGASGKAIDADSGKYKVNRNLFLLTTQLEFFSFFTLIYDTKVFQKSKYGLVSSE